MENNNRSVCPLIPWAARELHWREQWVQFITCFEKSWAIFEFSSPLGLCFVILAHERGIPCKCESSACVECVPAPCTHRPSLLPMSYLARLMDGWCTLEFVWEASWLKVTQAWLLRGSKSRNKVSVGEPAEGSNYIFCADRLRFALCKNMWIELRFNSNHFGVVFIHLFASQSSALAPTNAAHIYFRYNFFCSVFVACNNSHWK